MKKVAQLYPQSLGSLFFAFYDSQGYGGVIPTRPHMGSTTTDLLVLVIQPRYGPHRKCLFHYSLFSRGRENNVSTKLFPSKGLLFLHLLLGKGFHVTIYRRLSSIMTAFTFKFVVFVQLRLMFTLICYFYCRFGYMLRAYWPSKSVHVVYLRSQVFRFPNATSSGSFMLMCCWHLFGL
jgi:hypothetical protein